MRSNQATAQRSPITVDMLEEIGDLLSLHAVKKFIARKAFRKNRQGETSFNAIGGNFRDNFLNIVEKDVKPQALRRRLDLNSNESGKVIHLLGDEEHPFALAHVFEALTTADHDVLHYFFVADKKKEAWMIACVWNVSGWGIEAVSISKTLA